MPELLLELFSEEIPARMQTAAAKELERLVIGALSDRGLLFESVRAFAGPRRLTLAISGLSAKQPDTSEERKGPRVDAPEKAIEGFLRSAGVTLEHCVRKSDAKSEYYVAVVKRAGRSTSDVLAECLPAAIGRLPWPKSMRWPASTVRWVRPLHAIACMFDGEVVPFEFAGVASSNVTHGHRFLSTGVIEVRRFEDYEQKLRAANVILDAAERREIILHDSKQKAFAIGLALIEDEDLLDEVAGLVEWPVVLVGKIEDRFMDVPAEVLQTSMRTHQKYFALRDSKTETLANRFVMVANMVANDDGREIVAGNERVLKARLSDARFFWEQDKKHTLWSRVKSLESIRFYGELTLERKVRGIVTKSQQIASRIGADAKKTERAAALCKADLTSGIVGEFPELQGIMGRYYAVNDGEDREVAEAIADHYKPLGPSDQIPKTSVGAAVALADKLTTLYWLFLEGERPTGSKDPFGLRRAALGVVRIILEKKYRLELGHFFDVGWLGTIAEVTRDKKAETDLAIRSFIVDRLKVALRDSGIRHDLIDAVFSLGNEDDLLRLVARVEALQAFLKTDDGSNLLAGYRRAVNILRIEEKKDKRVFDHEPNPLLLIEAAEKALFAEIETARALIAAELEREHFGEAMTVMARLRQPVDAFFDKVMVNASDSQLRENRLFLLSRLRAALHEVADFSRIEG